MNKMNKRDNTYCCVPQCTSKGSKDPTVSFHAFPNVKSVVVRKSLSGLNAMVSRRDEWIRLLKIGKPVSQRMKVCSKHFTANDYNLPVSACLRPRLRSSAVPSSNLPKSSVENTASVLLRDSEAMERSLRHDEINRKRETTSQNCSSLLVEASSTEQNQSSSAEDNLIDEDQTSADEEDKEVLAVKSLLQLSSGTLESSKIGVDRETQVVSGDLNLPHIIKSKDLTDNQLKSLTGLQSVALLEKLADVVSINYKITGKHNLPLNERLILVFMKLKLNLSFSCLSVFFGCNAKTVSNIFSTLVPILAEVLESFIEFSPKEKIMANLPNCFLEFPDVRIVLDCTEILVQKPKCLNERILTYSQYKSNHTLKYLIGISPGGLITFVSKGYGGRASDKHIFEDSKLINMLEPYADAIMTDKGFLIDGICEQNYIKLIRPPFLKQKKQFSASEANLCKKIAHARVHVERTIQRLKTFSLLRSVISYNLLHLIDQIVIIIAGLTNLSPPILDDDKFSPI